MAKNRYNIAVIPGDGIGKEVVPEALKVLEKISGKHDINLHFDHFDFSSYDYFSKHGQMMPDDWKQQIGSHDALFFGAVGWPEKIPDHKSYMCVGCALVLAAVCMRKCTPHQPCIHDSSF